MTTIWTRVLTSADLGRFVADLRLERNLTQQELADELGLRRQYVNEIETGKNTLHQDRLLTLLNTLGARLTVEAEIVEAPAARSSSRTVLPRGDDEWVVQRPGATRASAVTSTQAEGIARAREILAGSGGGELQVRGHDGSIRQQEIVTAATDPRRTTGGVHNRDVSQTTGGTRPKGNVSAAQALDGGAVNDRDVRDGKRRRARAARASDGNGGTS